MRALSMWIALSGFYLFFPQVCNAEDARHYVHELHRRISSDAIRLFSSDLQKEFEGVICEAYGVDSVDVLQGRVAVSVFAPLSFSNTVYLSYGEDELHDSSAASSIKIAILLYYYHLFSIGEVQPTTLIEGHTCDSLLVDMIRSSNNEYANILLRNVGFDRINQWYYSLGFTDNEICFRRFFSGNAKPSEQNDNTASSKGLIILYYLIAQQNDIQGLMSSRDLRKLRQTISSIGEINNKTVFNDRLNGNFPSDIPFCHKSGSNEENIVDAGIVYAGMIDYIIVAYDTAKDRAAMRKLGYGILVLMKQHT